MNKERIRSILVEKHTVPDCASSLEAYLEFVLNYQMPSEDAYTENHHILPQSVFPEYASESWNIVTLLYQDHIKAHELLFKAFNIRTYARPLNYMKSSMSKDSKLISNSAKKGWQNLKEDRSKFESFKEKRKKHMRSLTREEQSRRAHKGWSNTDYEDRCRINKENWTPGLKKAKSEEMKTYFARHPEESSRRLKLRWENASVNERKSFQEKMNAVNKDCDKRQKASDSLKAKWSSDEFRDKMQKRKTRGSSVGGYVCISPSGEKREFSHLNALIEALHCNVTLVRKFLNTNEPVVAHKQKEREATKNTIGWKFFAQKYLRENEEQF